MAEKVWLLSSSDTVVAELHVNDADFPWLCARVVALPGFEELRPLFAEELRCLDAESDDHESPAWTAAYRAIRAATELSYPDGGDAAEYLLYIEGDTAWWRWNDEPFEDSAAERPSG